MRSLLAFTVACLHAAILYVMGVVYALLTILIIEIIWQSRNAGVYEFLWGLSFASYTLPKLVDKSFEKFKEGRDIMLETREQCTVKASDGMTLSLIHI